MQEPLEVKEGKELFKKIWSEILPYLKQSPANIWLKEVRKKLEKIDRADKKIEHLLKKLYKKGEIDEPTYREMMQQLETLHHHLKNPTSALVWAKQIQDDIGEIIKKKKAVLFDAFGTILIPAEEYGIKDGERMSDPLQELFDSGKWDPNPEIAKKQKEKARRIFDTREDINKFIEYAKKFDPNYNLTKEKRDRDMKRVETYPDTYQIFMRLRIELRKKDILIGIVSNANSLIKQALERLLLPKLTDEIILSSDKSVRSTKPDPKIYQKAIDKMGIDPAQSWMVGDNLISDGIGARLAGLNAIIIDRKNKYKLPKMVTAKELYDKAVKLDPDEAKKLYDSLGAELEKLFATNTKPDIPIVRSLLEISEYIK